MQHARKWKVYISATSQCRAAPNAKQLPLLCSAHMQMGRPNFRPASAEQHTSSTQADLRRFKKEDLVCATCRPPLACLRAASGRINARPKWRPPAGPLLVLWAASRALRRTTVWRPERARTSQNEPERDRAAPRRGQTDGLWARFCTDSRKKPPGSHPSGSTSTTKPGGGSRASGRGRAL